MKRFLPLLALSLLVGCGEGTALHIAETENSPESYEAFLAEYPEAASAAELRVTIEELRYKRARESRNPEMLRDFLTRHPDSEHIAKIQELEDEVSWQTADGIKTGESYKLYIDLHPEGKWLDRARKVYGKYEYVPKLTVGDLAIQKVNMAQDPDGPLNGWEVKADVTNTGDRRLNKVAMAIDYLGASGDVVRTDRWYTVVQDLGPLPVRPDLKAIMEPGETRSFRFTTAEAPDGWAEGSFAVSVVQAIREEPAEAVQPSSN